MSPLKSSKPFLEKIKKQISDNLPIYFLRQGVGARFAVLFPKYRVRLDTGYRQSWSVDWVEIGGTTNHQSANRHRHPICQIRNPDLPPSLCINPVHPRTISISGRWALTSRSPIRSVRSKAAKQQIMGGLPCVLFPRISNWQQRACVLSQERSGLFGRKQVCYGRKALARGCTIIYDYH